MTKPLTIRVNGESSITRLAEQGILRLTVISEGPELDSVSQQVVTKSNELSELFKTLSQRTDDGASSADAPVARFASTSLRTKSHTPYKNEVALPRVHQASMSLRIVFRDIKTLSQVIGQLVPQSTVEINSIEWNLSDATQAALCSQARREAIREAITKANDYAKEVGREVQPTLISDHGTNSCAQHLEGAVFPGASLFGQTNPSARERRAGRQALLACMSSSSDDPTDQALVSDTLELSPPDILVTVSVTVEFESIG